MNFDTAGFPVNMYHIPLLCIRHEIGYKLGAMVRVVEDVDTDEDGVRWGEFLPVKAQANFSNR